MGIRWLIHIGDCILKKRWILVMIDYEFLYAREAEWIQTDGRDAEMNKGRDP